MEWIKVSDRLPEVGLYIVAIKGVDVECSDIGYFTGHDWEMIGVISEPEEHDAYFTDYHMKVTHWMPLPEPPKETP